MRFNEKWLRQWINADHIDIYKICDQLTQAGLEVEEIQEIMCNYNNIIIGEIIDFFYYDDSKIFNIVKVNINSGKLLNILCDSNTVRINMKVVVAMNGLKLANNKIIKPKKINNIISEGKLCSFFDLDMLEKSKEIIELPYYAPVGKEFKFYKLYFDKIIKINVTPNRRDALGILGISRDVSILNNLPLPILNNRNISITSKQECFLHLKDCNMVFKYTGRCIQNINLRAITPFWMKEKLRKCSINSVNIVVDIMNYVFLGLGQSIKIFTFFNMIKNIFLRFSNIFETVKYNKKEIILHNKVIVISNNNKIISFIENDNLDIFPINLDNTNLFLGSIFLDPDLLCYSNYYLKLNNPNLIFHEYNVDPKLQKKTIEYATYLFLKICGGNAGPITKNNSIKYYTYITTIQLQYSNLKRILGHNIDIQVVKNILIKLGYEINKLKHFFMVTPPSWRLDIKIEEDVISDILRIYRYDKIDSHPLCNSQFIFNYDISENKLKRMKLLLIDKGYHEIITYSFVDPKIQNLISPNENFLFLKNPISSDMSSMRISLFSGLIKTLLYHQNRQYEEIKLFESGLCFLPNINYNLGVKQELLLSGIIGGNKYKKYWDKPVSILDFYDIKGDIESIFDTIGYLKDIKFIKKEIFGFHPYQSLYIFFKNIIIGMIGTVHPFVLSKLRLNYAVFFFELYFDKLFFQDVIKIQRVSEFPISFRDISVIVSKNVFVEDMVIACKKKIFNRILNIRICDIYTGDPILSGKKSVSLKFSFQDPKKTLKEQEIDDMLNICIKVLQYKFKAILRS